MGFSYSPLSLTVLREAPLETQGASTAGLQLSDVLGTALGIGVGGALIALGDRAGVEGWVGLAAALGVGAAVAAVGAILAGRLPHGAHAAAPAHRERPDAHPEPALAATGQEH